MSRHLRLARRARQAGFTLLELMVASVIAMVAAVTIFQTMSVSEERRRSTTSGSEGLQAGVFALASLERAIVNAGFNLTAISDTTYVSPVRRVTPGSGFVLSSTTPPRPELHLGCTFTHSGQTYRAAPLLAAATGANAGIDTDTLTIFSGSSATVPLPVPATGTVEAGATAITMASIHGFQVDDWVLVYEQSDAASPGTTRPVACTLGRVTARTPASENGTITMAPGAAAKYTQPVVINLGRAPTLERFVVDANGRLTVTNLLGTAGPQVLADNVVAMRVQLGIDRGNDDVIDEWINAPATIDTWLNPDNPLPPNQVGIPGGGGAGGGGGGGGGGGAAARAFHQIKAVRVGLLIRSPQFERAEEKGGCMITDGAKRQILPARTGNAAAGLPDMPASGTYTFEGDQRCFRYNTVSAVLGLRNALLSEM